MSRAPRFRRELVVLPLEQALVRDLPPATFHYPAGVTAELVQAVAAFCDGSRLEQDIVVSFAPDLQAHVPATLGLLRTANLLDDVQSTPLDRVPHPLIVAHMREYLRHTDSEVSLMEAVQRITGTAVIVVAAESHEHLQGYLSEQLRQAGFREVHNVRHVDDAFALATSGWLGVRRCVLLDIEESRAGPVRLSRERAWTAGMAYYSLLCCPAQCVVNAGPLLLPGSRSIYRWERASEPPSGPLAPNEDPLWLAAAAIASNDLLLSVAGVSDGFSLGHLRRIHVRTGASFLLAPPRDTWPASLRALPESVANVEQQFRREHRALSNAKTRTSRYGRYATPLPPKTLSQSVTFPLESAASASDQAAGTSVSFVTLARILRHAMGHDLNRRRSIRRANASAGNLGSAEVFVLARDVAGLARGIYLYEPRRDCLSRFDHRNERPPLEAVLEAAGLGSAWRTCSAVLVFTGALWRLYPKYGVFSARLVSLDAGAAMSQVAALTAECGLHVMCGSASNPNPLETLLNLRPAEEQLTGVLGLGVSPVCLLPAAPLPLIEPQQQPPLLEDEALLQLYRATHTEEGAAKTGYRASVWHRPEVTESEPGRLLPLESAIRVRRSQRRFAAREVPLALLANLAATAWGACGLQSADPLRLFLLAKQGPTSMRTVHEFDPRTRTLLPHLPSSPNPGDGWYVQREYTQAQAAFWLAGNLEHACDHGDVRGYSELLLQAGALGNLLWLLAIKAGLCGCTVAGVVHGRSARGLRLRAGAEAALLAVPLGYPANKHAPVD